MWVLSREAMNTQDIHQIIRRYGFEKSFAAGVILNIFVACLFISHICSYVISHHIVVFARVTNDDDTLNLEP